MNKKIILSILSGLCVALFLANCGGGDSDEEPMLSVSPLSITLDADGSEQTISVTSNTTWTVVSFENWVICSQSGGSGNSRVTISAFANTGEERYSKLTFSDKSGVHTAEVRVTQKSGVPAESLSVSETSMSFGGYGGSDSFTVTSNSSWTVSSNQSWCEVSPSSGSNNGAVTVSVSANGTSSERTANITVKSRSGNATKTIKVTQAKSANDTNVGRNDYDGDVNLDNK